MIRVKEILPPSLLLTAAFFTHGCDNRSQFVRDLADLEAAHRRSEANALTRFENRLDELRKNGKAAAVKLLPAVKSALEENARAGFDMFIITFDTTEENGRPIWNSTDSRVPFSYNPEALSVPENYSGPPPIAIWVESIADQLRASKDFKGLNIHFSDDTLDLDGGKDDRPKIMISIAL